MAGHSKWANIKHKKAAQDSKRSKIFQKISKEILVAIKNGGNNPDTNPRLRLLIEKAKAQNIPNANLKKLLEKDEKNSANYNEVLYEGYGPSGVAILVETLTDNINRTVASIKSIFTKSGGNLGTSGSVNYLFKDSGIIIIDQEKFPLEKYEEMLFGLDLNELDEEEDIIILKVEPNKLISIGEELKTNGIDEFIKFEVDKIAITEIPWSEELENKINKLIDKLEDDDDVQNVYTNLGS